MYSPERCTRCGLRSRSFATGSSSPPTAASRSRRRRSATMKRVQDVLGKLHDLQVLQTHIASAQIAGDSARPEPRGGARGPAAQVEAQCRHLHAKYLLSSAVASRRALLSSARCIVPHLVQLPPPHAVGQDGAGHVRQRREPLPVPHCGADKRSRLQRRRCAAAGRPMATLELYLIRHGSPRIAARNTPTIRSGR